MVVLAITSLLSALLLPALSRSRSQAKRIQCLSNLRQLGIAAQLYWDDYEGRSFRFQRGATNGGELYWFGWLQSGAEGNRLFDPSQGALFPYLGTQRIGNCSALNPFLPDFKRKASGSAFGYGYNLALSAPVSQPAINTQRIEKSAGTVLFGDAAQVNTFQAPASSTNPMLEEFYYLNSSEPTAHFRHSNRANVVFCDGHTGWENPVEGSFDSRLPAAKVGRIRGELLLVP